MSKVTLIRLDKHEGNNGVLCAYEFGKNIPFDIQRIFTVMAKKDEVRGQHAHKKCSQLLVCVSGEINVTCDDGLKVNNYVLDDMGTALLVPPGIWAEEEYLVNDAILMVICDRRYETDDYIHSYIEFKQFLGVKE